MSARFQKTFKNMSMKTDNMLQSTTAASLRGRLRAVLNRTFCPFAYRIHYYCYYRTFEMMQRTSCCASGSTATPVKHTVLPARVGLYTLHARKRRILRMPTTVFVWRWRRRRVAGVCVRVLYSNCKARFAASGEEREDAKGQFTVVLERARWYVTGARASIDRGRAATDSASG